MSNQHDEERARIREQRERQYEIDRITFEYATAFRSGRAPRVEDYVARYPQYASELVEFALYFNTIGFDSEPFDGPAEPALSAAGEAVMARIREQRAAYPSAPALAGTPAIETLAKRGIQVGFAPPKLAEAVGLTYDVLGRLDARNINTATIPPTLLQRLAAALKTTSEAIAAYLGTGPAGAFYYATQQPTEERTSFLDAIQASTLSPERKQEWAEIVKAEIDSGP